MSANKERFDTAYIYSTLHLSLIGACSLEEDKIGVRPVAARGHLMHAVVVDQLLAAVGDLVPVLDNVERRRERRSDMLGKVIVTHHNVGLA